MTQENKGGRTMIGTVAPVVPRPATTTHPRPISTTNHLEATIVPLNTGPVPLQAQTYSAPTVALRPPPAAAAAAAVGGFGPGGPGPSIVDGADGFIGQELCGYVIRRKLAEGGMGEVYEGIHTKIGRLGAIKVLKLELCRSEDVVERFYQEARAVNSIRHENIVDIYDFGRDPQGRVFFVMEYLEGEPLSARLQRGALTWFEAFPILEQTLRALKAAHDKGYVHRDLKPDNIWLKYVDGTIHVKLLDFGIAKLVGSESPREKLTQTGSVIGTPHYMSPEQINGSRNIDHRTDIYALGVIMYELFAGKTPFVGDTLQAIMTGHLFKEPPRLADIPVTLGVPAPIAEIVDRMLVKDANGRYDSVADVLADLHDVNRNRWPSNAETLSRTRPTRGATLIAPPPIPPPRPRRRGLVIGGVLAGAAVAVTAIGIATSSQDAPSTPVAVTPKPIIVDPPPPKPKADVPIDFDATRKTAQLVIRASLTQPEPAVRIQGADALGVTKDQPSVPQLASLTETDPDLDVRGHTAHALGAIGAASQAQLLGKLEAQAPAPLKVWYASALAKLGDKTAAKRLLGYARSSDLAVAFPAGLTLAEVSPPGDKPAIAALRAIAGRERELVKTAPYAGAAILTELAALHDAASRKVLYSILDNTDEGIRLAAAEGLARLGDDAGKQVLQSVVANQESPNRLTAAVAQIPLGEYGGVELITKALDAKEGRDRRLAARALGQISDRKSLPALIGLQSDKDWTVRVAAAAAIVAIVGLDPLVLAQASVDWTNSALESKDWAVRRAAAGVLADIPEQQAIPLLAQAIADPEPKVRLAALKSAGKMKTAEAASKVVAAVAAETDPKVKEQQITTLGQMGNAVAHDTLAQIADLPGRLGVLAAGSLIAVGDTAGKAKLDAAIAAPDAELRLAAMQAATTANKPILIPTLKLGILDQVFGVRFAAAEGLAMQNAEKASAVLVLNAALDSKNADPDVIVRAVAALTRFGEKIRQTVKTPLEMLDELDPKVRLAAVPIVRALPAAEAVPLLRRLVADPDEEVRRAGVDAIEGVVASAKDQAIKLYKPLVTDTDPVVRSKAAGQLARLVEPTTPKPTDTPIVQPPPKVDAPPPPQVTISLTEAKTQTDDAKAQAAALAALATELTTIMASPKHDDATTKHVGELAAQLTDAAGKIEAAADQAEAAARMAASEAGAAPSVATRQMVDEASRQAKAARTAATDARSTSTSAAAKARDYVNGDTGDVQGYIAAANTAIAAGNYGAAKQSLDTAAALIRKSGSKNVVIDESWARLYDGMASHTGDAAAKLKLLRQAMDAYRRFAKGGSGPRVQRANDRATEIVDEIKELGTP
jgi:serine/threonine-protein kinase